MFISPLSACLIPPTLSEQTHLTERSRPNSGLTVLFLFPLKCNTC